MLQETEKRGSNGNPLITRNNSTIRPEPASEEREAEALKNLASWANTHRQTFNTWADEALFKHHGRSKRTVFNNTLEEAGIKISKPTLHNLFKGKAPWDVPRVRALLRSVVISATQALASILPVQEQPCAPEPEAPSPESSLESPETVQEALPEEPQKQIPNAIAALHTTAKILLKERLEKLDDAAKFKLLGDVIHMLTRPDL